MPRGIRWNRQPRIMSRKEKAVRFKEMYAKEVEKKYRGEEEFMNSIHPFEKSLLITGKKSSPIQKAIIYCIISNGGVASEGQILEFIKNKWNIIEKYSERGFSEEPNLRLVRLNCAVKKKCRHLFLKIPNTENLYKLNSNSVQKPEKKKLKYLEEEEEESSNEDVYIPVMKDKTFESKVEEIFMFAKTCLTFDDICTKMKRYEKMDGVFKSLKFPRRVRACLIVLKREGKIIFSDKENTYSSIYTSAAREKTII